jgi:hypothetical protein
MDLRCVGICLGRAGHADAALEVIELTRLHQEHTGRVGNIAGAVMLLEGALSRSRELAGIEAERSAVARARSVEPSLRVQRVLELAAAAINPAA